VNTELRDNLGNFINRALKFVAQNFEGKIPKPDLTEADHAFVRSVNEIIASYIAALEKVKIKDALREVMNISFLGNKYTQDNKPWQLLKDGEVVRCGTIVYVTSNLVKILAALIEPYMPSLTDKILAQLNSPHDQIKETFEFLLPVGHVIGDPQPLIAGIEPAKVKEFQEQFSGAKRAAHGFTPEIRIGRIVGIENHEQADHLYVLRIDLGKEQRTIVSGLRAAYRDKDLLLGKLVLVLCNLKESKFKGVLSQGMLLVADFDSGKQLEVLTVKTEVPLGTLVLPEDHSLLESKQKYTVPDFLKLDLQIVEGSAFLDGNKKLLADGKEIVPAGTIRNAKIR